ncbi:MAG TPA: phosphotransferase [Acidimicrobiales bacterium]|nr:phosphotransferase [Acidimicrobiales bacterium]
MPPKVPAFQNAFGLDAIRELRPLHGGYQGKAWTAELDGDRIVLKLVSANFFSKQGVTTKQQMLARLAVSDPQVCGPIAIAGELVTEATDDDLGPSFLRAFEFAPGRTPDVRRPNDGEILGRTLARLHLSMSSLPPYDLGPMRAFTPHSVDVFRSSGIEIPPAILTPASSRRHLLHGDFGMHNVKFNGEGDVKIFDFDDCGYGTVEEDVGNSLYMAMFRCFVDGDGPRTYEPFRARFLNSYTGFLAEPISIEAVSRYLHLRVFTLLLWLARPDLAPPGVADSSASWKETLAEFANQYVASEV